MRLATLVAILGSTLLLGCTFPKYIPIGDTEHLARFRVISTLDKLTLISKLDGNCYRKGDDKEKLFVLPRTAPWGPTRNSIGIPIGQVSPEAVYKEIEVPAGISVNIGVTTINTPAMWGPIGAALSNNSKASECAEGIRFLPRAGADYELYLKNGLDKCHLALNEIVRTESGAITNRPVQGLDSLSDCD